VSQGFANLSISRIILHAVHQKGIDNEFIEPTYSNSLTTLDPEGMHKLQERIIGAMGNESHSIELNIQHHDDDSAFRTAEKLITGNDAQFIDLSKKMALKLAKAQASRKIPSGVIVIFTGTIGAASNPVVGIIKAEKHGGFATEEAAGLLTIKYLNNLLLTPQQKLYKIGLFIEDAPAETAVAERTPEDFKAFVYDHNMSQLNTQAAAIYFYDTFLGCTILDSSKKLTRDFYYGTKEFIDNLPVEDEKKVDMNVSLYTYLKVSQDSTISIKAYADSYLDDAVKPLYERHMISKKFPENHVVKDLTLLKNKLRRRGITFSSKIRIVGPSDNFSDLVEIGEYQDGKTTVKITGKLEEQE
jgi:hypothetical protein